MEGGSLSLSVGKMLKKSVYLTLEDTNK